MGGCLDDSSLTCNTAQTFADAAQVCKALDGSSYNILPPSSLPPPPTASAAAAASAAPHFDLHHHHHNSRATSHHARGLSADPSCPSASGAAGHGSAVATSSASPTVTPITGEKTSPSASSSLSTATPANCFTTVSGGNSASNAPGVNPAEGDLGATRAFGLRLQQPRQQRPQQSLAQGEAALPQERQQAAAAAAGRGATPAVRVRRSLDVEGLAMKFDAGVSEGSAEPALAASTQAAAAVTEDAAAQVKALAGGIGAVVIASPAGAGPCIAHRDAALDDGAGI